MPQNHAVMDLDLKKQ